MKPSPSVILPVLLGILIVAGCSGDGKPEASRSTLDTTARAPSETPAAPASTPKAQLEKLAFNKSAIPPGCEYVGKLVDGARWRDANGENVLLVSQVMGGYSEKTQSKRQELYSYLYTIEGTTPKLLWKTQDGAENMCDEGEGLTSDIRVEDIDRDGIAENAFIYNIEGRCDVSPAVYKLLMHSGPTKYAIRGTNRVGGGGMPGMGGDKKLDFGRAPETYGIWASRLWDQEVK